MKLRIHRAGAPSRWLPGWFATSPVTDEGEHFDTWAEALEFALSFHVMATMSEATA